MQTTDLAAVLGTMWFSTQCVGSPPEYPAARDLVCESGAQLPDSKEKSALLSLCKASAAVDQCAQAYEKAREAAGR